MKIVAPMAIATLLALAPAAHAQQDSPDRTGRSPFRYVYAANINDPALAYESNSSPVAAINGTHEVMIAALNGTALLVEVRIQAFSAQGAPLYSVKSQIQPGWKISMLRWSNRIGDSEFAGLPAYALVTATAPLHVDAVGLWYNSYFGLASTNYWMEPHTKRAIAVREIDCYGADAINARLCSAWSNFPPPGN